MDEAGSREAFTPGAMLRQVRSLWPALLGMGTVLFALGMVLVVIYVQTDVNPHHLVADAHEIAFLPEYVGMYSSAGVLLLWTAGIVSLVTGAVVRGGGTPGRVSSFHTALGLLLCLLAADDLFVLHEWAGLLMAEAIGAGEVGFERSRLEAIVFAGIGVLWLVWIARYWRTILRTEFVLLGLGMAAFGSSVAIDLSAYVFPKLEPGTPQRRLVLALLEELLKLAGIFLMLAYALRLGRDRFREIAGRPMAVAGSEA